jgi:hypothetical protein
LVLLLIAVSSFSQVTITTEDLQCEIGQYYKMYNIPSPQGVIGMTGIQGGPYVFDFSSGSTAAEFTIDYVDPSDGGHNADFPSATIAEKKITADGTAWMYMDFQNGIGRTNYGFYDPAGVPDSPSVPFHPSIVDFPENISYQSYFSGATNFAVSMQGYDLDIAYEFTGFVDGWGTVILPDDQGEHNCIQVNYEEKYTYYWMSTPIQVSYLRSYYYIAEDIGIVAIITSREEEAPVPNNFNIANTIARRYETSKVSEPSSTELVPAGFKLSNNYPNPFNPQTTISYELPFEQHVQLGVYDITGQLVNSLVSGRRSAGNHEVVWSGVNQSGRAVASGIYYYRIDASEFSQIKKMTLVK